LHTQNFISVDTRPSRLPRSLRHVRHSGFSGSSRFRTLSSQACWSASKLLRHDVLVLALCVEQLAADNFGFIKKI